MVSSGNESYQRSVDEGLAEQHRLVSEAEVVRRANEEAHRIVSSAHADSNRLRGECDTFVDQKLSEFEDLLSSALRTVSKDRAALRRGAGVSGRGMQEGEYSSGEYSGAGEYSSKEYSSSDYKRDEYETEDYGYDS